MPMINGVKYACEPCMRGHRSSKCGHHDRILIKVRKPGRPLSSCPHEAGSCSCEVASVAIPRSSSKCPCTTPSPGITKPRQNGKSSRSQSISQSPFMPHNADPSHYPMSNGMYLDNQGGFIDPTQPWPNPIDPLSGLDPMIQQQPMDLNPPLAPGFFGSEIPPGFPMPPSIMSNGQQPYGDPNEMMSPVSMSSNQNGTPHGIQEDLAAALSGLPPAAGVMDPSDAPQTTEYTIYMAEKYSPKQLDYLQTVKNAHARQKQAEAEETLRASQASEYAQHMNAGSCCSPANNVGGYYNNNGFQAHDPLSYQVPHGGADCTCGDGCGCLMCSTHPYNQASMEYVRNMQQLQSQVQSPGEHASSSVDFTPVMPSLGLPTGNDVSITGNVADITGNDVNIFANDAQPSEISGEISGEINAAAALIPDLSPSGYVQIDYPDITDCSVSSAGCMCGTGCNCQGCQVHHGHNGIPLADPQTMQPMSNFQVDQTQGVKDQTGNISHFDDSIGQDHLKSDGSASTSSIVHVEHPEI
ncbi:hypothetical protein ABW21_db0201023 [Orbilia brochopaga]|nr:hypothetical protein ABW21_db0201023 [Drechslerella brochopaga]